MTTASKKGGARAVADVTEGLIFATVDIAAAPDRVFRALTTPEDLVRWWGADDVYRTTGWTMDLRKGGAWRAEGRGADGHSFSVEGEFLEIEPPRRLVQTWRPDWDRDHTTTITYRLDPIAGGTRVTVRHEGFAGRAESCLSHTEGWERVLAWLDADLVPAPAQSEVRWFLCRLIAPRPTFAFDMTPEEAALMAEHGAHLRKHMEAGSVVAFGPVGDPAGPWGMALVRAADEAGVRAITAADPTIRSERGFRYEVLPMLQAVLRG